MRGGFTQTWHKKEDGTARRERNDDENRDILVT